MSWGFQTLKNAAGAVIPDSFNELYGCIKKQVVEVEITAKEAARDAAICVLSAVTIKALNSCDEGFSPTIFMYSVVLTAVTAKTGKTVLDYFKQQR